MLVIRRELCRFGLRASGGYRCRRRVSLNGALRCVHFEQPLDAAEASAAATAVDRVANAGASASAATGADVPPFETKQKTHMGIYNGEAMTYIHVIQHCRHD
jgi:hypothetical protein